MTITFEHNHLRDGEFPKQFVEDIILDSGEHPIVTIKPTNEPFIDEVSVSFYIDPDDDEISTAYSFGKLIGTYQTNRIS